MSNAPASKPPMTSLPPTARDTMLPPPQLLKDPENVALMRCVGALEELGDVEAAARVTRYLAGRYADYR